MRAMEQRRQRKRATAILLGLVAAAGLVVGTVTNAWLTSPEYGEAVGMGLREISVCDDGKCVSMTLFDLVESIEDEIVRIKHLNEGLPAKEQMPIPRDPWNGWPVTGWITFVAALVAAGGLTLGVAFAAAGKRIAWPVMPTTIGVLGLMIGIICGCIFVATKPDQNQLLGVGWSFMTFGGAAVLGLASVFPLNRQIRPLEEELGAASATMSCGGRSDGEP